MSTFLHLPATLLSKQDTTGTYEPLTIRLGLGQDSIP